MSVAAVAHQGLNLPATPYKLWVRNELADYLRLPHDGSRVEVIGGEIVVSPGPTVGHNGIIQDIVDGVVEARFGASAFPWRCIQTTDLNLRKIQDGYVPDLIVLDAKMLADARRAEARQLYPEDVGLVVEVTSRWNAGDDRRPTLRRPATKWAGYARVGVGHYLLIDRDPDAAQATLFFHPDGQAGTYRHHLTWRSGETIALPEPFSFEIATDEWHSWDGD